MYYFVKKGIIKDKSKLSAVIKALSITNIPPVAGTPSDIFRSMRYAFQVETVISVFCSRFRQVRMVSTIFVVLL